VPTCARAAARPRPFTAGIPLPRACLPSAARALRRLPRRCAGVGMVRGGVNAAAAALPCAAPGVVHGGVVVRRPCAGRWGRPAAVGVGVNPDVGDVSAPLDQAESYVPNAAAAAASAAATAASPGGGGGGGDDGAPHATTANFTDANFPTDAEGRVYHLDVKRGEEGTRKMCVAFRLTFEGNTIPLTTLTHAHLCIGNTITVPLATVPYLF